MSKKEFFKHYERIRTEGAKQVYAGSHHSAAALAMTIACIPDDFEKFWRKYGRSIRNYTPEQIAEIIGQTPKAVA